MEKVSIERKESAGLDQMSHTYVKAESGIRDTSELQDTAVIM